MKKIILGVGLFLAGVIIFCSNYIVQSIVSNLPNVTIVSRGSLGIIAVMVILVGGALSVFGYFEE